MEDKRSKKITNIQSYQLNIDSKYEDIKFFGEKNEFEQYYKAKVGKYKKNVWIFKHKDIFAFPLLLKQLILEQYIMSQLNMHDNLFKPIDIIYDQNDSNSNNDLYLVYEYRDCCLDMIDKSFYTIEHVRFEIYLLLRALIYLHSAGTIHCNVKPESILLDSNDDHLLSQFQYSLPNKINEQRHFQTYQSLNCFSAPEILLKSANISTSADIWSVGVIFLTYIAKKQIFSFSSSDEGIVEIVKLIGTPSFEDFCEVYQNTKENQENLYQTLKNYETIPLNHKFQRLGLVEVDFLQKSLSFNPKKRLDAVQLFQHTFFNGLFDQEDIVYSNQQIDFNKILKITHEGRERDFFHKLSEYYFNQHITSPFQYQ